MIAGLDGHLVRGSFLEADIQSIAGTEALEHAEAHGERDQDDRGQRGPDRDDRPGGEDVLKGDLDEEIRSTPERAEQEEQCEGSARHLYGGSQNVELTPNRGCLADR